MEPLGYTQVVRRWWWLIAGLVLAALVIVYVTTPARFVEHFQATHVLLVESDSDSGRSTEADPEVVALWAKESEVLTRAAAAIGPGVDPEELGRDIEVDTDRVGTVSITATDLDPERAALKANTVANETVAFLIERETNRGEQTRSELAAQEQSLRERISALDAAIAQNPADIDTQTAERDALIRQLGTVLESQDTQASSVTYTTLDEPERGTREDRLPGTRSRLERMLLAGGVALILGFGLALTLDRSDTRVRSRRSAEEQFGLPVIAEVVKFPFYTRRRQMVVARQPDTAVAESYRTLRSALMLGSKPDANGRSGAAGRPGSNGEGPGLHGDVVMVTSAGSGDGKTTTVANLAAAFGESGCSVLVLSFDLHRLRGRHKTKFRRPAGVTEYLAADPPIPLETLVMPTKVQRVSVVGIGNAARPPGGQFAAQQRLLAEARELADVILVDTAPLLASSINRELATMVDRVVALCRVGRTTRAEAERCGDLLAQLDAPAIGVVMIGVSAPEGSEYFAYFTLRRDRREAAGKVEPGTEDAPVDVPASDTPPGDDHVDEDTSHDVPVADR